MDKRSFNFLFTIVAASMVIIGTYKIAKKKTNSSATAPTTVSSNSK